MTAEVIDLFAKRAERDAFGPGNGAREVVDKFLYDHGLGPAFTCQVVDGLLPVDYVLAWLWQEGYKVVPLDAGDKGGAA